MIDGPSAQADVMRSDLSHDKTWENELGRFTIERKTPQLVEFHVVAHTRAGKLSNVIVREVKGNLIDDANVEWYVQVREPYGISKKKSDDEFSTWWAKVSEDLTRAATQMQSDKAYQFMCEAWRKEFRAAMRDPIGDLISYAEKRRERAEQYRIQSVSMHGGHLAGGSDTETARLIYCEGIIAGICKTYERMAGVYLQVSRELSQLLAAAHGKTWIEYTRSVHGELANESDEKEGQ